MPSRKRFSGFGDSETFTSIPDSLFSEFLAEAEDLSELKVALYAIWRVQHMESGLRALSRQDFPELELGLDAAQIDLALNAAVKHQVLLRATDGLKTRILLNSAEGRAVAQALAEGTWQAGQVSSAPLEHPSIFAVYEQNIGPLTPLIADALKDAETSYPVEWITEAMELAVRNNKRSWSYCEAILRRWKEEGRGPQQNRRDDQAARQRDVEEKIRRFIRG